MPFSKFITNHLEKKKFHLPKVEFKISPYQEFPFLKYLAQKIKAILSFNGKKVTKKKIEKKIFDLKYFFSRSRVLKISNNTILVEESNFKKALEIAISHFRISRREHLLWKKIYYSQPTKEKKIDAYKFVNLLREKDIVNYITDVAFSSDNYLPLETEVRKDGKYLMCHAPMVNTKLAHQFIKHFLIKLDVIPNDQLIKKIYSNPNKWHRVGQWVPNPKNDASGKLKLTEGNLYAYLEVKPASKEGKNLEEAEVQQVIDKYGINYGINWEKILQYLKKKQYNEPLLMAEGVMPQHGEDMQFDKIYLKNISKEMMQQKKVNIFLIKKGETILETISSTKGIPGVDVFGKSIPAQDGKNISINTVAGKNTLVSKDGKSLSAIKNGHVYFHEGRYSVQEILELPEVSLRTGNINHSGTVIVNGSVYDGFSIKGATNIVVNESVGSAILEADGDIEIKLGMSGKNKGKVTSNNGSIYAKFLQDCEIFAQKDLIVEKLLSGCDVEVGDRVRLTDIKGSIWSGHISAYNEVFAENLGSVSGRKVFITIGITLEQRKKIKSFKKDLEEIDNQVLLIKNTMKEKTKQEKKDKTEAMKAMEQQRHEIQGEIDQIFEQIKNSDTKARVIANLNLFSGVTINIGSISYQNRVFRKQIMISRDTKNSTAIKMEKIDRIKK